MNQYVSAAACMMLQLLCTVVNAQNLSSRSNEINLIKQKENPSLSTGTLPLITWIRPQEDFTSSVYGKIEVNASVKLSSPAARITLIAGSMDDNVVWIKKNITTEAGQLSVSIRMPVTLPDGSNYLELQVETAQGVVVSEKRKIMIGAGALDKVLSLDRKDVALLFGTDKYDHWTDLVNPIDDARAIGKELKEKYGFQVEIVENATVEEIWKKLREYNEKKFSPQDQLFIFFAGHGHYDDTFGEGFVVAKNSLEHDLSRNTYISHNRLRGVISNIQCNHILLTMDVCFGGTLDPVLARSRGASESQATVNEMLVRKWSNRTRKYLTSGGKEYVSDGIPGKHSPFSEKLIESLRSMGGNDRLLTLAEIQVELEKLKQLPRMGSFADDEAGSDFVFVGKRQN